MRQSLLARVFSATLLVFAGICSPGCVSPPGATPRDIGLDDPEIVIFHVTVTREKYDQIRFSKDGRTEYGHIIITGPVSRNGTHVDKTLPLTPSHIDKLNDGLDSTSSSQESADVYLEFAPEKDLHEALTANGGREKYAVLFVSWYHYLSEPTDHHLTSEHEPKAAVFLNGWLEFITTKRL